MRQLFQNLVGNALKFRRQNVPSKISIRATLLPDPLSPTEVELEFEDNGIGFDQKFADQIFVVFQRLHGRGEYEGSGIGLAVCRKIADRHQGTIRAESVPEVGSRFLVRLPVRHRRSQSISQS